MDAILDIARDIESHRAQNLVNLAGGDAGLALFYTYLSDLLPDRGFDQVASDLLDASISSLSDEPGLYSGFTGVAWAGCHLTGWIVDPPEEDNDPFTEIDEQLAEIVSMRPWRGHYDLISGLVGYGVYALERMPNPAAENILNQIVARLGEMSAPDTWGRTWFTPEHLLTPKEAEAYPTGRIQNLGVAHGIPGIIGLLGRIAGLNIEASPIARSLLSNAAASLVAQPQSNASSVGFPAVVSQSEVRPTRLAWCYGDPGVAAALLLAARSAQDLGLEERAIQIARRAAARPIQLAGVKDAGLCHGAAGLAHIYNRLFQATGDQDLGKAATYWFEETLRWKEESGVGGYRSWGVDRFKPVLGEFDWHDDPGFLTGAAGVGLALIAAVDRTEPSWDRVLLISVPPVDRPKGIEDAT